MRRPVQIRSNAHISTTRGLLVVEMDGRRASIPSSEISTLVIENMRSTITTACLSKLAENGVTTMFCGRDHMPIGMLRPLVGSFEQPRVMERQLGMGRDLADALWARIVSVKISNQAECLRLCGKDPRALRDKAVDVLPGDSDNREATAARDYFEDLLDHTGRRDGPYSAALDYGYSILRSAVAREVVAAGWLAEFGIHHHGRFNAFNLVDDLMEPYRPLIDLIVITYDFGEDLTARSRDLLASSMGYLMRMGARRYSAQRCVELMVESLKRSVENGDAQELRLPTLIELAEATRE